MQLTGRCYCGDIRYEANGDAVLKVQCHCRECQYLSGGGPNFTFGMPVEGFAYTQGTPAQFTRTDIDNAVTREFCPRCGTQILTRVPVLPQLVLLKVGTLDNPADFGAPEMAVFTIDQQAFHLVPEDIPSFERLPE
jgi:hypothetical protein